MTDANQPPTPAGAEEDITTSLYRAAIGPVGADYYLPIFTRFEEVDRAGITWNTIAAFFTLHWLLFRKLYLYALAYAAAVLTVVLLVFGIGRVLFEFPDALLIALGVGFGAMATALPGLFGNALLHTEVRKRMAAAVAANHNMADARTMLLAQASTRRRGVVLATVQAVLAILIGVAFWQMAALTATDPSSSETTPPAQPLTRPVTQPVVQPMTQPLTQPPSQPITASSGAATAPPASPTPPASAASASASVPASPSASQSASQPALAAASAAASVPAAAAVSLPPTPAASATAPSATTSAAKAVAQPASSPAAVASTAARPASSTPAPTATPASAASSKAASTAPSSTPSASTPAKTVAAAAPTPAASRASSAPASAAPASSAASGAAAPASAAASARAQPAKPNGKASDADKAHQRKALQSALRNGDAPTPTKAKPATKAEPTKPAQKAKPSSAPASTASTPETADKPYYINVGLFAVSENAQRVQAQLQEAQLPVVSKELKGKKGPLTRIRVGPFTNELEAQAAADRIKALQLEAVVVQP